MKRDIEVREVSDLGIAVVSGSDTEKGKIWDVYLVNMKRSAIANVLVNVSGRSGAGSQAGQHTATLRYYFAEIAAESWVHVEALLPEVMQLDNLYWVSFQHEGYLFDKKYTVPKDPERVAEMWLIPLINKVGMWFE